MGMPVLIYGKSGSGKSRSLKNFAEDEVFIVNVEDKHLPFRKKFKYEYVSDDVANIKNGLLKMPVKTAVIDDAGYILTNLFMRKHRNKSGSAVYDLYNDIGDAFWTMFEFIKRNLPKDTIVYIIMHEETDDSGNTKLKMLGKLLEQKVCVEGMVTVCLRCITDDKGKHLFVTNSDGFDISKSPEEMFENQFIENDLKFVDDTIRKYYGIN